MLYNRIDKINSMQCISLLTLSVFNASHEMPYLFLFINNQLSCTASFDKDLEQRIVIRIEYTLHRSIRLLTCGVVAVLALLSVRC